ncbi:hypothetical protein EB796_001768 [Bugula neritina]|uniref:MKRN2 opposite strand protein-like C-terminal domain-containing protein n=1 Tax=Bugula neritina TaxID=10212 RepID=A0A7J7KP13_BUGNE|nr:hypothetical protein EB796_001768 [Bugula neritina]
MLTTELKVPPFIYSSPFTIETTSAIALLIKPSLGKSFLYDYKDGDSLHCGILDSFGHVHDFDEKGLHFSLQRWLNCISIPVDVSLQSNKSMPTMDDVKEAWAQQCVRYDSETANCFTFVLFCLKSFGCYKHSSETDFLTEVVLPHTAKAAKYISLYRRLVSSGGTLVNSDDT